MKKQTGIRKEPYIGSFSSFSEKHTEQIKRVTRQLSHPASAALIHSEHYTLQEHYAKEIILNVLHVKEHQLHQKHPHEPSTSVQQINYSY